MDTSLKTERIEYYSPVWRGSAVREVAEEVVVPDALEDVGTILDTAGILSMQSKETVQEGVQLSASLAVTVVFVTESGGDLCGLEIKLPADIRLEAPAVDVDCRTVSCVRVRTIESRIINSRKIRVRAELEADAVCFRSACLRIAGGMENEDGSVHFRRETAEAVLVSDVREKTFAVTDELAFPAGVGSIPRILSRRAEIVPEDVKLVGGKALFRGRIRSELLFSDRESGHSAVGRYETEFSHIMEMDADSESAFPETALFLTGAYYDMPEYGGDGRLQAEFHLGAQCVCRERRRIGYIADLYSNRTELVLQKESLSFVGATEPVVMRQTVADRIEVPGRDAEILQASASVGPLLREDGAIRTSVDVRLIFAEPHGGYAVSQGRLPAEFTLPSISTSGTELRDAAVTVTDIYCVPGTGDVRVSLRLDAAAESEIRITCVNAVQEDAEAWTDREKTPSAVLLRVPEGNDLWEIARRYHSTVEEILSVNEGRNAGLLLIPKSR